MWLKQDFYITVHPKVKQENLFFSVAQNLPANAGDNRCGFDPWEDPLQEEMATHSSILALRIPWTEEPGRLQTTGSQRVGYDWSDLTQS